MPKYRQVVAGQLRHTVTVQRATKTQNTYGEDTSTWADLGTFPAWVYSLQGRELASMQQTWAEARFGIWMRYQPGISFRADDRVLWVDEGDYFDILDVSNPDGRRVMVEFICKEYVE